MPPSSAIPSRERLRRKRRRGHQKWGLQAAHAAPREPGRAQLFPGWWPSAGRKAPSLAGMTRRAPSETVTACRWRAQKFLWPVTPINHPGDRKYKT
jgi:hypothetical protein